jgi:hypothetical protein
MLKVSSAEFHTHLGRHQDMARSQAGAITRNDRDRTVLISAQEYQRLMRRDRRVMTLDDFTDADIAALETTRAPDWSKAFGSCCVSA